MDVKQILALMATLSIGLDQIDTDDPKNLDVIIFMQYLNLAYFEILNLTLTQNPQVPIVNQSLNCNNGICDATSSPIFIPKSVYDIKSNRPLEGTTLEEVMKRDPGLQIKTAPALEWYYSNGTINIYPNVTSLLADGNGIGIRYIAQPAPLTRDTPSSGILIPYMYQQLLADGASYYLFQSETGFKDQLKMQAAFTRWEEGKRKLFAYMKNISGKKHFSTYSPI